MDIVDFVIEKLHYGGTSVRGVEKGGEGIRWLGDFIKQSKEGLGVASI